MFQQQCVDTCRIGCLSKERCPIDKSPSFREKAVREQARRELERRHATQGLAAFCAVTDKTFVKYPHTAKIIEVLEALTNHDINRAIITVPPRHGKSYLASERYPAYLLGRMPRQKIMLVAYNSDLAQGFSRKARDLFAEPEWPFTDVQVSPTLSAVGLWGTTNGGEMRAGGFGGTLAGAGATCFPVGTMISTPNGPKPIEVLADTLGKVYAYDLKRKTIVVSQIRASKKSIRSDIVEVTTAHGRNFKCTVDHPIYVIGFGYVEAGALSPGSPLVAMQDLRATLQPKSKTMLSMCESQSMVTSMRSMCYASSPKSKAVSDASAIQQTSYNDCASLHQMRYSVRADKRRARQIITQRLGRSVLWNQVRYNREERIWPGSSTGMQNMRDSGRKPYGYVLFARVPSEQKTVTNKDLSMRCRVHSSEFSTSKLFSNMRGYCSFVTDGGFRKLSLQRRNKLRDLVSENAATRVRARRASVHSMRGIRRNASSYLAWENRISYKPDSPPYRRKPSKQYIRKPNHALWDMSCNTPQIGADTVAMVCRVRGQSIAVYDLDVENQHNFFAEEICVSNCLLIDDPVKNPEEANSPTHREKIWDFYGSVVRTRMEKGCTQLIVLTRWNEDDLAGRLLNSPEAKEWHTLTLPVHALEHDPIGRAPGELLWPEGPPVPDPKDGVISKRMFAALYQQSPTAIEGDLFKREWFSHRYRILPVLKRACMFIDGAWKTGVRNDPSAIVLWGDDGVNYYLIDVWSGKVEYPELKLKVKEFYMEHREVAPTMFVCVEDAASGTGLVQELKREKFPRIPIYGVVVDRDKYTRAESTTPLWESGRCWLPENATWLHEFVEQYIAFPGAPHDDLVDAGSSALTKLSKSGLSLIMGSLSTIRRR